MELDTKPKETPAEINENEKTWMEVQDDMTPVIESISSDNSVKMTPLDSSEKIFTVGDCIMMTPLDNNIQIKEEVDLSNNYVLNSESEFEAQEVPEIKVTSDEKIKMEAEELNSTVVQINGCVSYTESLDLLQTDVNMNSDTIQVTNNKDLLKQDKTDSQIPSVVEEGEEKKAILGVDSIKVENVHVENKLNNVCDNKKDREKSKSKHSNSSSRSRTPSSHHSRSHKDEKYKSSSDGYRSSDKSKHESSSKSERTKSSSRHNSSSGKSYHKSESNHHRSDKHDSHHSRHHSSSRSSRRYQSVKTQCTADEILHECSVNKCEVNISQPFTRVPWVPHPQIVKLKYGKFYRLEVDRNGGASTVHLYMDEISHLFQDQLNECAIEFIKLSYSEDENENAHYVMGIVHGAASYLPDLVDYMADHYPTLIVKTGSLASRDNHTTTMSQYRDEVYKTYSNGSFRYAPLDQLSICGVLGEEVGAYFPDFVSRLEQSPFMKPVMPWSVLSVVHTENPRESNDGPIFWVRPGEQMIPANEALKEGARPKRRRNNELDNLAYIGSRLTEARESLFMDRTKAHADQIGVDFGVSNTAPTAAVGVLKSVNCGHPEHGNRATKDVIAFHAGDYNELLNILMLDLYEPPQTQCTKWIEVSKLNTLRREGIRYSHVQLHDNDVYYLPRKIIHQFQTISSVASVAWHIRYKDYFKLHGAPNLHAPTGINKGQVFYEKKEVPAYCPPIPDLDYTLNGDAPSPRTPKKMDKLKTPRKSYKYGSSSGRKEKKTSLNGTPGKGEDSSDSMKKRERSDTMSNDDVRLPIKLKSSDSDWLLKTDDEFMKILKKSDNPLGDVVESNSEKKKDSRKPYPDNHSDSNKIVKNLDGEFKKCEDKSKDDKNSIKSKHRSKLDSSKRRIESPNHKSKHKHTSDRIKDSDSKVEVSISSSHRNHSEKAKPNDSDSPSLKRKSTEEPVFTPAKMLKESGSTDDDEVVIFNQENGKLENEESLSVTFCNRTYPGAKTLDSDGVKSVTRNLDAEFSSPVSNSQPSVNTSETSENDKVKCDESELSSLSSIEKNVTYQAEVYLTNTGYDPSSEESVKSNFVADHVVQMNHPPLPQYSMTAVVPPLPNSLPPLPSHPPPSNCTEKQTETVPTPYLNSLPVFVQSNSDGNERKGNIKPIKKFKKPKKEEKEKSFDLLGDIMAKMDMKK